MLGVWISLTHLFVGLVIVFPVYLFLPESLRGLYRSVKGFFGAILGGLIFVILLFPFVGVNGFFLGAVSSGFVIGFLAPKSSI